MEELKSQNLGSQGLKVQAESDQMYKFLVQGLEGGEMSEKDYKELIQRFLNLDQLNLKIFTSLKLANPIVFVQSRMLVFKKELEQFK